MAAADPRRVLHRAAALRPNSAIALTSGEPAGIGPDLCLAIAGRSRAWPLVCLGDRAMLAQRARALGLRLQLCDYRAATPVEHDAGRLSVLHQPLAAPAVAGQLEPVNAAAVLALIDRAVDGCLSGEFCALVTAPVHKALINEAGFPFIGHTEYIAQRTGTALPVMMLTAGTMRVALATTHLPLRAVSDALSSAGLVRILEILTTDLERYWGLRGARIAVCGLNPHAGEAGYLGDEEQRIIGPAIAQARALGLRVEGPLPADTVFVPRILGSYDVVLAMYHDQGLPVLKHAGFGEAVNVTLGLPIVRTSVDHGTALDLAGRGSAEHGSLLSAIELAAQMATRVSSAQLP